jgi:hypothetical protein
MVPGVLQDVEERGPDFARRAERPGVEAIGEDGPAPVPESMERPSDSDEQRLHPARQRASIAGLGDQVDMVRLQGEVDQPEAEALAGGRERTRDRSSHRLPPQAGKVLVQPHGRMDRMRAAERRPRYVRYARGRAVLRPRLAAGSRTSAAPAPEGEIVLSNSKSSPLLAAIHVGVDAAVHADG